MIQGISSLQGSWGQASATGKAGLAVNHKQPKSHRPLLFLAFMPVPQAPTPQTSPWAF